MDTRAIVERHFEGTGLLMKERRYPRPLPPELAQWYCYPADSGHSILCLLGSGSGEAFGPGVDTLQSLLPVPVKAVLRGYLIDRGFVVVDLPYDSVRGLVTDPADDEY